MFHHHQLSFRISFLIIFIIFYSIVKIQCISSSSEKSYPSLNSKLSSITTNESKKKNSFLMKQQQNNKKNKNDVLNYRDHFMYDNQQQQQQQSNRITNVKYINEKKKNHNDNQDDNIQVYHHEHDHDHQQIFINAQAKVQNIKGKKRKRVKAKFKKWLSIFSHENELGDRVLTYYGLMLAGAIARASSATFVHPLNVIKTLLQTREGNLPPMTWYALSRGAGSQFLMSIPHGAMNFAVTETSKITMSQLSVKNELGKKINPKILNPMLDFISSAVATFICSIVSTPQMVITDRIMTGKYENFIDAVFNLFTQEGIHGFYRGWFPALCQKIPSYALTWMFFQQIKSLFLFFMKRSGNTLENTVLGSISAAGACCVMIPVDTVKTRMVMQSRGSDKYYEGMMDCFRKIIEQEGVGTLYRALPPRLAAVMPMIGIQFSVYELMKRILLQTDKEQPPPINPSSISSGSSTTMKMYPAITQNKQGLLKKEVCMYRMFLLFRIV